MTDNNPTAEDNKPKDKPVSSASDSDGGEVGRFLKKTPKQLPLPMKSKTVKIKQDDASDDSDDRTDTSVQYSYDAVLSGGIDLNDLKAGRSYWFVMIGLVLVILTTAVKTAHQAQERHEVYRKLSAARLHYQNLKTEETRLIIEQQTFSATPIVAQRAVVELGMFYPTQNNRVIIHPEP